MLNSVSANTLIKSVITTLATIVILMLAFGAWQSWQKVGSTNRIVKVADASAFAFRAMHNLRTDRSTSTRALNADAPVSDKMMAP
jgi:hypothetical protein